MVFPSHWRKRCRHLLQQVDCALAARELDPKDGNTIKDTDSATTARNLGVSSLNLLQVVIAVYPPCDLLYLGKYISLYQRDQHIIKHIADRLRKCEWRTARCGCLTVRPDESNRVR